jgi:hypothetical protein
VSSSDAPLPAEAQSVSKEPVKKGAVSPADGPAAKPQSVSDELTKTIEKWLRTELPLEPALRSRAVAEAARIPGSREELPEEAAVKAAGEAILAAVGSKVDDRELPPREAYEREKDPEWFAAATLVELIRRQADENEGKKWANLVANFIRLRDEEIGKLIFASEIKQGLNAAEFDLLKLFFIYNPKLVTTARVFRFYLVPGKVTEFSQCEKQSNGEQPPIDRKKARNTDELRFPFAFALLATVTNRQTGKDMESLVYFRVQDHVRRMGLGREALQKMLSEQDLGELKVKLYDMHPDAHEVPTSQDRLRFLRLFDSAQALRQTGRLS